jgi:hypothetical protein
MLELRSCAWSLLPSLKECAVGQGLAVTCRSAAAPTPAPSPALVLASFHCFCAFVLELIDNRRDTSYRG